MEIVIGILIGFVMIVIGILVLLPLIDKQTKHREVRQFVGFLTLAFGIIIWAAMLSMDLNKDFEKLEFGNLTENCFFIVESEE